MHRAGEVHTRGARLLNECTTKEVSLRTYWGVDLLWSRKPGTQDATVNLSQARPNILPQILLTGCFLRTEVRGDFNIQGTNIFKSGSMNVKIIPDFCS